MEVETIEFAPRKNGPTGLGGWLILPLLGLVITIGTVARSFTQNLIPLLSGPNWAAMTTVGGPLYHPLWVPYVVVSLVAGLVLAAAAVVLLVLAIKKRSVFPMLMVGFYVLCALTSGIDLWAINTFLPEVAPGRTAEIAPGIITAAGRAVAACLIWIPYFVSSKRVSNTFVN